MDDIYPTRQSRQANLIARKDPVFYGQWHPSAPLTEEQIIQFDRNGYLILENVFTQDEVSSLQLDAKHALQSEGSFRQETIIKELGSHDVRSIFEIHQQSALMGRLASDYRLAGIASFLLNDEVYIHQSRLNYKPGLVGKEFYWHSDFETWHAEDGMPRMRALSMSVLLTENTAYNGSLMLLPGSHHTFLSCTGETPEEHYKVSLKKQDFGVPDNDNLEKLVSEFGIINSVGAPGSVLIFDCNVMHGSNSNITPLARSNAFFVYNAISNQLVSPYSTKVPRPDFVACRDPQPIFPEFGSILNTPDLICC